MWYRRALSRAGMRCGAMCKTEQDERSRQCARSRNPGAHHRAVQGDADLSVSNLLTPILSPIAAQTVAEMSQRRTKNRQTRSVL
jgi:hypothetical protein